MKTLRLALLLILAYCAAAAAYCAVACMREPNTSNAVCLAVCLHGGFMAALYLKAVSRFQ
jgi:hypothetical protein